MGLIASSKYIKSRCNYFVISYKSQILKFYKNYFYSRILAARGIFGKYILLFLRRFSVITKKFPNFKRALFYKNTLL
jgi:hypothetical protein